MRSDRLNVIRLDIPPLRERVEDIEPLIAHFSAKHIEDVGEEKNFELAAISLLKSYHWPENVRELENFYLRLGIHTEDSTIRTRDLVEHIEGFRNLRKAADNTSGMFGEDEASTFDEMKDLAEKMILSKSLRKHGSISETARQLKMTKSRLYNRLKGLDLLPTEK